MSNKTFNIAGMHCASCATNIEHAVNAVEGVTKASVNFASEKLYVDAANGVDSKEIKESVERAGDYTILEGEEVEDAELKNVMKASRKMWFSVLFAGVIMGLMMVMMFTPIPYYFTITAVLAFPVIFIAGWETHKGAIKSLRNLSPNMDTLVTLGSLVPYVLSLTRFWIPEMTTFVEMAASIMTLHLVGRFLEAKAKGKASQAIKKLLEIGAKKARIIDNGQEKEISVEELRVGDIMIVRPGEKIPTDGLIIEGKSHIDESMATGESLPVTKKEGDPVIGSTISKEGMLKVQAVKIGKDTFLSQIVRLVEECQGSKVPIQEFADRATGYFVPSVMVVAAGAFISWMLFPDFHIMVADFFNLPWTNTTLPGINLAILATTAVLVISCPCALGLATPTALIVGSGIGAERGIFIRRGEAIQTMKDIRVVIFDKTGTITEGRPVVTDIAPLGEYAMNDVLLYAASLEYASEHPLASAILEKAKSEKIQLKKVDNFVSISGKGVAGEIEKKKVVVGNEKLMDEYAVQYRNHAESKKFEQDAKTVVFVAVEGEIIGILAIADDLKKDSINVVKEIQNMGIRTAMITGDNRRTAAIVAEKTGIDYVVSEVLPEEKLREVQNIQKRYGLVAMVGDGINDAPALKQANVGIAIGTGTDIAIESADITLIRGDLGEVISAIKLSRETFRKIQQNYFWAWFYNAIAIPVAFFGLLHPIMGAAAMALSSLNVVMNSLRLKKKNIAPDYM